MPNDPVTLSTEEYQTLLAEREALQGELRLAKPERDLAEERLREREVRCRADVDDVEAGKPR